VRKRQKKKNRKRDELTALWTLIADGVENLRRNMQSFNEKLQRTILSLAF
jgi:hypothetical protein